MKKFIKLLSVLTLLIALPFVCVTACAADDAPIVRVAALKGPTGMALAHMMTENDGAYDFTLAADPAYTDTSVEAREFAHDLREAAKPEAPEAPKADKEKVEKQLREMRRAANTKLQV